jgi:hypothetical protein
LISAEDSLTGIPANIINVLIMNRIEHVKSYCWISIGYPFRYIIIISSILQELQKKKNKNASDLSIKLV